jgi:NAD(P)-dependent dehydrogenase (short-subunit alcohol dehydrogenase family)
MISVSKMRLAGRTAVITGAASGIGRGLALALARRGCHLALADLNAAALAETCALALAAAASGGEPVRISQHPLDVADAAAVVAFPAAVRAAHPSVDLLFNNAGVSLGGTFEQVSAEDFDWLMAINFGGVVRMTRAFLPLLRQSDDARIVNLSSIFGIIAPAGQTAYSASKFAVRGFSIALRQELAGTNVGVSVVHPGGVATDIAKSARFAAQWSAAEKAQALANAAKALRMPPEEAAEKIVRGAELRRARILVGADAKLLTLLERIAPVGYGAVLARLMPKP